jgi:hypothetical protein
MGRGAARRAVSYAEWVEYANPTGEPNKAFWRLDIPLIPTISLPARPRAAGMAHRRPLAKVETLPLLLVSRRVSRLAP